jgi:hypothetical protein
MERRRRVCERRPALGERDAVETEAVAEAAAAAAADPKLPLRERWLAAGGRRCVLLPLPWLRL